jgi:ketosteroid isomerase-like protein
VPWGGTFRGREGFRDFLAKVFDQPAEFRREILEYLAVGERVVVLLRLMGSPARDDAGFEVPEVHLWTVRDGKVVAFEGIFDTATVMRDLRLQPTD